MSPLLAGFFLLAVGLRVWSLAVSRRHERALLAAGATEHGAGVSNVLAFLHTLVYVGSALEGTLRAVRPDAVSVVGMILYALGMAALAAVVAQLGRLWTVRLLVAPDHELRSGGLFRVVRHPNYTLNLVPELLGLGLAFHGWVTLAVVAPAYALTLRRRVVEEERVMAARFPGYGGGGTPPGAAG